MLSVDRSYCRCITILALSACTMIGSQAFAQAVATAGYGASAQVGSGHVAVSGQVTAPVAGAPAPVPGPHSERLDNDALLRRGVVLGVGGAAAGYTAAKVSAFAKGTVSGGKLGGVPHWGPAISSLPVIGGTAAKGAMIPTTLGQVPVMGAVVNKVPVVGPVVAGPANPVLVGAVAIDNYVIPKYSPCGYTKSSVIAANNDFNVAPRLRSYVNYLAPLPYTHPPIYSPSTLKTDLPADVAYIDGISEYTLNNTIDLPDL